MRGCVPTPRQAANALPRVQYGAMWMPKDIATWLAIIALILVIQFNFFSTWAYPKLQDWWAARSRKSLRRRIDKLETSLAEMYEGRGLTMRDEWVLLCAEQLGSLIFWGVNILAILVFWLTLPFVVSARHPSAIVLIFVGILSIYRIIKDFLMAKIRSFRLFAGPMRKIDLERSIADLTARLATREHRKTA